ncbi:ABC transporter ATP-binding protein, partial [bacterium]|nr:ABC transporter ATP-binding protein [bacterium]
MIEVDHLTKFYGTFPAVSDVSFRAEKGEIMGLLGPNGAGKTTTMRILTCHFPATSGNARVAGFDVDKQSMEVRRRLGYLPENVPLYLEMRTDQYLYFVAELKGVPSRERKKQVDKVVSECGLSAVYKRTIRKLSKGYRQRVGLAQALLGDPEVLILDEPTVGLDPQTRSYIWQYVNQLRLRHQTTIFMTTHYMEEAENCDRIAIIDRG